MMEKLISGVPASKVFRELQEKDESIDARKLGEMLVREFPDISPAASMSIRKWLDPKGFYEFSDEQIDGLILHYLRIAGYMT